MVPEQSPNCCLVSFFVLNLLPTSVYTVLHSSAWRGWLVVERKRMLFPTNCKRTCKIFTIFIITHPSCTINIITNCHPLVSFDIPFPFYLVSILFHFIFLSFSFSLVHTSFLIELSEYHTTPIL